MTGGDPVGKQPAHRTKLRWRGRQIETLADIPPRPGGVLLVGVNPAPVSVAAGHYYQGRLGQRLWTRLERLGLLVEATPGAEDDAFARGGHGLTDVVKRSTSRAADVTKEELKAGTQELTGKLREWKPGLVLFPFVSAARAVLGPGIGPGQGPEIESIPTFVLSGPYASSAEASRIDAELLTLLSGDVPPRIPELAVSTDPRSEPALSGRAFDVDADEGEAARSQRVTSNDRDRGQIRLPRAAKRFFPTARQEVTVVLRGMRLSGTYDPRTGPDRERSAVLRVGRAALASVGEGEVLTVTLKQDGTPKLD